MKDADIKYSIYDQTIPNPTIGNSNFGGSAEAAIIAGRLIIENIQTAYRDGQNIKARENLQKASYLAGFAFMRAYVGYVHSIAHSLGGMYHTPHGLANAIILPHVLDYYGEACEKRLGFFAKAIGAIPAELDNHEASKLFIMQIRELNRAMGIPEHLDEIQNEDIPTLAKSASKPALPRAQNSKCERTGNALSHCERDKVVAQELLYLKAVFNFLRNGERASTFHVHQHPLRLGLENDLAIGDTFESALAHAHHLAVTCNPRRSANFIVQKSLVLVFHKLRMNHPAAP